MTGIASILLRGAMIAAVGFAGVQSWRLDRASTSLIEAQSKIEAYADAARIAARVGADLAAQRDEAAKLDHDLNQGGTDAPLSDFLRDSAGRLWR